MVQRVIRTYQNAYSGLSPSTWWLSLVMLINRSGTMVVPFMTLYLTQRLHYSVGKAGIVMAIYGAGAVCGGLMGGKLSDKMGFHIVQLSALLCGGLLFILLGQMESYTAICIVTYLLALINDSFRPANASAIAFYSKDENRTRSYSLNRLAINLGWAAGGALGGFVASKNYHLLFWIDGLTNIGAAVLLKAVLAPAKTVLPVSRIAQPARRGAAYKDKIYLAFIACTILYASAFFQLFITPVFYGTRWHLSTTFIGCIMALNGLIIAAFEMVAIFKLDGKRHNLHFITIGVLLMGASFIILNILPSGRIIAIVATVINTGGEMLSMPFMNSFWVTRTTAQNRGQYAGLYTVAWSAAQVLGPGAGAQVAQYFSFSTLWWVVGGACLIAAAGYKWLQLRVES